jgi:DNA-binding transcriptional MerR regulator
VYSDGVPTETPYAIADLAHLTGVSVRTIRYYLAQGLLPASGESGPGAHYGQGHLDRLQLTKRLQEQHQPLSEIRVRLGAMSDDEVAALASEDAEPVTPSTSALEYVRSVLGAGARNEHRPLRLLTVAAPLASVAPGPRLMVEAAPVEPAAGGAAASAPTTEPTNEESALERSQWERLALGPNVELHIRRPLSRLEQRRVERLITIARQVLKEGQS